MPRTTRQIRGALILCAGTVLALAGCETVSPLTHVSAPTAHTGRRPAQEPATRTIPAITTPSAVGTGETQFATEAPARAEPVSLASAESPSTLVQPPAALSLSPGTLGDTGQSSAHAAAETKSDEAKIKVRGRIEADAISVTQSPKDKALFGDFQNAVGFRRARIGAEGTVGEQTRWVGEFDFAGGNVALKDMFLAVNHLPVVREARVGHFPEPFSLEGMTRSVWFPFTERSPAFTLDPARNWGVGVFSYTEDRRLFVQAGAFRSGTNNTGTDIGDGNDMAYTARVVGLPWYDDSCDSLHLLHVGGAASQRYAKDNTVTFNQGPQSSLLQSGTDSPRTPFVPTVSIPADRYQLYNLQAALVLGPLSFQAEWNATRVEQTGGGPVVLSGWYVFASYFLTGEHRNYNREVGTFWEPTVRCPFVCTDGPGGIAQGPGAWEVTARLAYLDFDNPNLPPGPSGLPVGTRTTTITLGLNWYLNDNARIMLDWVHAIPDLPPFGSSTADLFTVRSAIFW